MDPFFPSVRQSGITHYTLPEAKWCAKRGCAPFGFPRATAKSVATLDVCRHFLRFLSARRRQQNIPHFAPIAMPPT